jgi:hypothetical protein
MFSIPGAIKMQVSEVSSVGGNSLPTDLQEEAKGQIKRNKQTLNKQRRDKHSLFYGFQPCVGNVADALIWLFRVTRNTKTIIQSSQHPYSYEPLVIVVDGSF